MVHPARMPDLQMASYSLGWMKNSCPTVPPAQVCNAFAQLLCILLQPPRRIALRTQQAAVRGTSKNQAAGTFMLEHLTTESRNPASEDLDGLTPLEIVRLINAEDAKVAAAVASEAEAIG